MFQQRSLDISKDPLLAKIVTRVTALVKPEAARQSSEIKTQQNYIQQEENAAATMVACMDHPPGTPCVPTIQRYPRRSPQLIPGAVPGVNCGIGFQNSCYGANDGTLPNEESVQQTPAAAVSPQTQVMTASDFSACLAGMWT